MIWNWPGTAPNPSPAYRHSRECYWETLQLLKANTTPTNGQSVYIITVANYLDDIDERLREGRDDRAMSGK